MKIEEVKSWASVIDFIVRNMSPDLTETDVLGKIRISRASFYAIKKGKEPGIVLQRKLVDFIKREHNISLRVKGDNVMAERIEGSNIAIRSNNNIMTQGISEQKEFLLNKVIELEIENKRLKLELEKYKN